MDDSVKKRKIFIYTFLEVIATLILTMVGAMWDWVNMTFSLSKIMTSEYWTNVFVQTVMYSCALLLGTLMTLEKSELKNKEFQDLYSYYQNVMFPKIDKGFEPYIDNVLNPNIKKEFLHKKYKLKLYALDKMSKDRYKIDFRNCEKSLDSDAFIFSSKGSERYYKRRKELEEINSDEFIDENYEILSVNYPRVPAHAFTKYLDIKLTDKTKYKVTNKVGRSLSGTILNKVLFTLLWSAVIGMLFIQPDTNALLEQANGWIAVMIQYFIRVLMIVVNFTTGIYTGRKLFIENFILPINNRNRIIEEYEIYKQDHPALTKIEQVKKESYLQAKKGFDIQVEKRVKELYAEEIEKLKRELNAVQNTNIN